eukprot:TRINITY_DN467_c0_g1_i6.p1 TRINITY_DN467_c0_g1~~TRINITY_DN467_c0_g1_i6.p1  ORF type:complete len:434 (+),score=95.10 TRINITY_DN467_c0_g1_i6:2041-3342(+)
MGAVQGVLRASAPPQPNPYAQPPPYQAALPQAAPYQAPQQQQQQPVVAFSGAKTVPYQPPPMAAAPAAAAAAPVERKPKPTQATFQSSSIADNYLTLEQVQSALQSAGLESSNLIIGIDCTKSNLLTGRNTFGGKSLHSIQAGRPNPYQDAISIIGRTLEAMDDDRLIPTYGFGDATSTDKKVFSFLQDDAPCDTFEGVLQAYNSVMPAVNLSGPTSFGPIIRRAIDIVQKNGGAYHILVIIADGQVQKISPTATELSPQERDTIAAIVEASQWALSIVMVGVGDGPWEQMEQFDDNIPQRQFDNFQFVNFSEIAGRNLPNMEAVFAMSALMEIPEQFQRISELGLLGNDNRGKPAAAGFPRIAVLPPPQPRSRAPAAPAAPNPEDNQCQICMEKPRDMAFSCGHIVCESCSASMRACPFCRQPIQSRLRLYR